MTTDVFRRAGFVVLACAVIAAVCGTAMIVGLLRGRVAPGTPAPAHPA